ncbi:hypothetical protein [Flavonifractor sp. An306]|uniref:hypothetical protein n=1 Tax=Flavonifractor sp. An306 TaxID=1965629 RepID=UPI000B4405A8|nr:hypothetical protein [Flavonifractor sp. An306]OUO26903.1 hypothetical protein B5F88_19090 [Flavonifractor sp. An306]
MKFHTLVLEGDKNTEKEQKTENLPRYSKSAYLHRKQIENRPPLFNRSFYLCRIIEEELRGIDIDGSRVITICAHQNRLHPGNEKYICDNYFHVSIYYLEPEEVYALNEAKQDMDSTVIGEILEHTLIDIAHRNNCSEDIIQKMESAFISIANHHFMREERIDKLSKRAKDTGLAAHIYRVLSAEVGEAWYVEIIDRKGTVICQENMGTNPDYVDRLNSRLYAKAAWRKNTFMILDRFGNEVFHITVPASLI